MKAGTGLTRRGWRMLAAGVVWCVVAWFIGQRDLWWPGMFLVGLPALSWLILLPSSARLEVVRQVTPERGGFGWFIARDIDEVVHIGLV